MDIHLVICLNIYTDLETEELQAYKRPVILVEMNHHDNGRCPRPTYLYAIHCQSNGCLLFWKCLKAAITYYDFILA